MPEQPLIIVGAVIKPHGLAGEFSVMAHVDSPEFFALVPRLYLRHGTDMRPRPVTVESWRLHNRRLLLKLHQVSGRDQVDSLRGAHLMIREEDLPQPEAGEIYVHDLIGVRVILPSGALLGRIHDVNDATGQEVWAIRTEAGQEVLFPAHEDLVLDVDMAAKVIRIDPPPGLVELYLGTAKGPAKAS